MSPAALVAAWRIAIVAVIVLGALWVYRTARDNAAMKTQLDAQAGLINDLGLRAEALELASLANDQFDNTTRGQATAGVARNESARRTDSETIAVDRPWPAAMRQRVFDNPDPASGSTDPARDPAARER